MSIKLIYIPILFLFSCINPNQESKDNINEHKTQPDTTKIEVISLNSGKDVKFKGMSISENKEYGYFGSWSTQQIIKINLLNKKSKILESPYSGKLNGMGTFIRDDRLYAVMNEIDSSQDYTSKSVLLVFDLSTDLLLSAFELLGNSSGRNHFNHVVVDKYGIAYISNTLKSCINYIDTNDRDATIQVYIADDNLNMIHGLDLDENETKIFCTSYSNGIQIVDLVKKELFQLGSKIENQNDCLIYSNGLLFGVGSNMIKKYILNEEENQITETKIVLKDHELFNDPRCLQIIKDELYCLANIETSPVTLRRRNIRPRKESLNDSHLIRLKPVPNRVHGSEL